MRGFYHLTFGLSEQSCVFIHLAEICLDIVRPDILLLVLTRFRLPKYQGG